MIQGEAHLMGLNASWLAWCRWVLAYCDGQGLQPTITSGRRSQAQQRALYINYRSGRTSLPAAPPGYSAHEYGLAIDVWAGNGDQAKLISIFKHFGAETVGNDPPHFQYPGFTEARRKL